MLSRIAFHCAVVLATVLLFVRGAHADGVDTLVKQLGDSSSKVRLAAALNLAKAGDERGILPLAKTLLADSSSDVRAAAAVALGKLVVANPSTRYKGIATGNLRKAQDRDSSSLGQRESSNALN